MKRYIDASNDNESLLLLADLQSLTERAESLSKRFDSEHVAVGTFWGVTRGLREALDSARREILPEGYGDA